MPGDAGPVCEVHGAAPFTQRSPAHRSPDVTYAVRADTVTGMDLPEASAAHIERVSNAIQRTIAIEGGRGAAAVQERLRQELARVGLAPVDPDWLREVAEPISRGDVHRPVPPIRLR